MQDDVSSCSWTGIDLGPLDPLQYPTLAIDSLERELQQTQQRWRTDVQELEALVEHAHAGLPSVSEEDPVQLREELESMTGRFEAVLKLQENSQRDIRELETMVEQLMTENRQLKERLRSCVPTYKLNQGEEETQSSSASMSPRSSLQAANLDNSIKCSPPSDTSTMTPLSHATLDNSIKFSASSDASVMTPLSHAFDYVFTPHHNAFEDDIKLTTTSERSTDSLEPQPLEEPYIFTPPRKESSSSQPPKQDDLKSNVSTEPLEEPYVTTPPSTHVFPDV